MDDLKRQVEEHGPSRVSRKWGVSFEALKSRFEPTEDETGIRAFGRPGMRQYVIAVKKHGAPWPPQHRDAINVARKKYDRGTQCARAAQDRGRFSTWSRASCRLSHGNTSVPWSIRHTTIPWGQITNQARHPRKSTK
jgi:hypothetical protein